MTKNKALHLAVLCLFTAGSAFAAKPAATKKAPAQPAAAITGFAAVDMPYDAGGAVLLRWPAGHAETPDTLYTVYASTVENGGWVKAEEFKASANSGKSVDLPFWAWDGSASEHALKVDLNAALGDLPSGAVVHFKVESSVNGAVTAVSDVASAEAKGNWFRLDRLNNVVLFVVLVGVFFWAVSHAKRKGLFIRRIAGLDAIDEAIGRATEMGKPIYYTTGNQPISYIGTIASTFILGEVSKKVAQYDSMIQIPHYDPVVMTVCKEVVKQSYLEAGRPDSYRDDSNFFVSNDQFSFAASVDGLIAREKPAAVFFMGYFAAEALLLAEVGAANGAIQIAGTDAEGQLPFFFTACEDRKSVV